MPRTRRWRRLPEIDKFMIKRIKERVKQGELPQRSLSDAIHSGQAMRTFLDQEDYGQYEFLTVHGLVKLTPVEQRLVATPLFNRLNYVKQLETVSGGFYPGATHSRLAHSLGTLHLAGRIVKRLKLPPKQQQEIRIAALLHDVGHTAFGHALEPFIEKELGVDHEQVVDQRIRSEGVDELIRQSGHDYDRILSNIRGEGLGKIITDFADRIDYLQRDLHHSGAGNPKLAREMRANLNKVISGLAVKDGQLCVREEAKEALEKYAKYRNVLSATVYFHPASMMGRDLLRRAVEKSLEQKAISAEDFFTEDEPLLRKMEKAGIPEAHALFWHSPWLSFDPAFQTSFRALNERGKLTVQTKEFKKLLERKLAKTLAREDFIVAVTPNFEKPLKVRVLKRDGTVEPTVFAPKVGESRKIVLVACRNPRKLEEAGRITHRTMQPYLKEKRAYRRPGTSKVTFRLP